VHVGSIPTAVKQTFQLARCGHTEELHHKHKFFSFHYVGNILSTLINLMQLSSILMQLLFCFDQGMTHESLENCHANSGFSILILFWPGFY
jgi:hypothetical protein